MTLILLGIFLVIALVVLGQKFPALQQYLRWWLAIPVILILLAVSAIKIVPPGNVGILILFGKVHGAIPEGLHFVNPMVSVHFMNVRTQEIFEHAEAPSKEGLNVVLEVSCLYHLIPEEAARVYRLIGPRYQEIVVKPQFRSAIRGITVRHEAKDLYTSSREMITNEIYSDLAEDLRKRGVEVEKILLRRIQLPKSIEEAINAKLAADQEAQRMRFILDKEKQEAERKRIEAQGIQDFQRIVSQGISDQLLRWKGIEATEKLASSNNAKVVIVGGKDGLPLILNTGPEGK
jgi:regulator of protease activity HflC (stomatin/prohibitin superfamily)|uniref:Prohibitin family protein n=1 Tax=Desulfobacca acetoxidans TaxID=60893 RepID=A0A7C3SJQ3_9BACT